MVLRKNNNCVLEERFPEKEKLENTNELLNMIVKFNTDATFQEFAKNTSLENRPVVLVSFSV